jgi:predicted enzyme related to lactoylglutathione lyase
MSRVVHFEIQASQPQRLIEFYSALLDWKFEQWGTTPYWLIETGTADAPGINGGLLPRRGAPPAAGQGVNAFVCTAEVESLDATLAKSLSLGGVVAVPKMPIPGVGWLAYIKDPDGNILGLMQSDAKAK